MAALRARARPLVGLLALTLAACASVPAPVSDRSPGSPRAHRAADDTHVVVRGDTVYGIAFRNGLDWRDFAAWNRIPAPYTIFIGQRLRLTPPSGWRPSPSVPRSPDSSVRAGTAVVTQPPARVEESRPARVESLPADQGTTPQAAEPSPPSDAPAPVVTAPGESVGAPSIDPPSTPVATTPQGPAAATRQVGGVEWRWPAQGPLLRTFAANDPLRQGIDIVGSAGDPVYAAADGEVVYSGSGLVGYGELVIIKHSEQYLSAYGHNRERLVSEGQRVRGGQQIAEMGRTGTDREKLHFEIRRGGRPVNPAEHLPSR